jgi:hypothetical protein
MRPFGSTGLSSNAVVIRAVGLVPRGGDDRDRNDRHHDLDRCQRRFGLVAGAVVWEEVESRASESVELSGISLARRRWDCVPV